MTRIAVIQARVSSSRLPAKVLLPLNGVPVAVLAAVRAGNTGCKVVVATSSEPSDDALTAILESSGISYFRGSLHDTLSRVVEALSDYDDETIVYRLTADNVFPDGQLLDEIAQDFFTRDLEYLCCNGEPSGLPYGVSVEITRCRHLREANRLAESDYDREHVTPYVRRKYGTTFFTKYQALKMGHYRSTIDTLDDYLRVERVFRSVPHPFDISALELIDLLAKSNASIPSAPVKELVLGGAQLGGAYGICNQSGGLTPEQGARLISSALAGGVEYIDTARAYGGSEGVIGRALKTVPQATVRVITKLSPLAECPADALRDVVHAFVDASVYGSCVALGRPSLDVLMLHRAVHLDQWGGEAWKRIMALRDVGTVGRLGASVQSPQELLRILREPEISFIQMPFNLLDHRWGLAVEAIRSVRAERELTVHVRSAFLQGLLLSDDGDLWRRAHVSDAAPITAWLRKQSARWNRKSVADLCLAYVRSQAWVDGIVVGMERHEQLAENLEIFRAPPLNHEALLQIGQERPALSEQSLDPAQWITG
ncbi:aldo/keto reductase [Microvirga sp. M2]|uniref:aldo/keto reductase n=1 Tax=Microvirga sp. M2 TaxID=3073270 RepID=UPI0039C10764